ncbi:hypothetical protein [uncultured Adlercreutzia sp.]|uniref:hypothetical protein n=1 Tax=uncultured Adlercreutzia sp. TaxID=875803 RepID=UPI0025D47D7D|nr:hypothetical protein [uncultured Adlercreutzia sp.]
MSGGFVEQYPVHLKLANTAQYPTSGLDPFVDSSHPVRVDETTVAASSSADTPTGANGVPVTLAGTTPVTVSYWATVSGEAGDAVMLSQQLIEDSFQGSHYATTKLVNERPLEVAPDGADPSDPSSGAGTAWHYTRLPKANENGWNVSPVTLTFYPGDYDVMELTPSEGSATTLTAASPAWTRSADTEGVSLEGRAKNTATSTVSVQRAGKVKIDSSAPRVSADAALSALTLDDRPSDASKATSGIWRLYRTNAAGAVPADARAAAFREFSLTGDEGDRKGEATQTVANVPNGYYVAEDAAGNLSDPFKVCSTEPPAVDRPGGSIVDPDNTPDPSDPDAPKPVGPPIGPDDRVPAPTVTDDDEGLRHAVIDETISEIIDPANPAFGGSLDLDDAKALVAYRYDLSSQAGPLTETTELLAADGSPLASLPTDVPGECLIRHVATDAQGNTTTINLRYRFVRDNCPTVSPLEPVDPNDPTGPTQPGDPLTPTGPVVTDPDGSQSVEVACDVTEAVTRGTMDAAGAIDLLARHFALADADGNQPTVTVQSMRDAAGNELSMIDLSRVADYAITYLVRDAAGNATTVRMAYHLVSSRVPGVIVAPDPGTDLTPQPGDDPLNPKPRPIDPVEPPQVAPDGTQHAVIEDAMKVPVEEGKSLGLADVRSLMDRRYTFTPEGGGRMTELSLVVTDMAGAPVSAIDHARPGAFRITWKVADANGNTVTVNLRYLVVSDAPTVTPTDPDGSGSGNGSGPDGSGTPGNGGSSGSGPGTTPKPLVPSQVTIDENTGLTHAVVNDTVVAGTSDEPMTPEAMDAFIAEHYRVADAMGGEVTRSAPRLFDADGNPVDAIDRSKPGRWLVEQVLTDQFGNTTTLKLVYEVRESTASGSMNGAGDGDGADGSGNGAGDGSGAGNGNGDSSGTAGKGTDWASRLHDLPQTGGILGPCPLHIVFVLMMLLTSAYTLMRLRQEKDNGEEVRHGMVR